jgi:hypothetical protein
MLKDMTGNLLTRVLYLWCWSPALDNSRWNRVAAEKVDPMHNIEDPQLCH